MITRNQAIKMSLDVCEMFNVDVYKMLETQGSDKENWVKRFIINKLFYSYNTPLDNLAKYFNYKSEPAVRGSIKLYQNKELREEILDPELIKHANEYCDIMFESNNNFYFKAQFTNPDLFNKSYTFLTP